MSAQSPFLARMLSSKACQPIPRALELELIHRFHAGDRRAGHRVLQANLKFVANVARRYAHFGLPMDDLVQEGSMGLQRAIEKYNTASGIRLISYGVWWIRQRILQALCDQARTYAIPQRFLDIAGRMTKTRQRMEAESGRPVTLIEVAEAMKVPREQLEVAIALLNQADSLDTPVNFEDGMTYLDALPAPGATDAAAEESQTKRNIRFLLSHLGRVDQDILMRHYGFITGESETLAQIADRHDLSRERIRQRVEKALPRLRKHALSMDLYTPKKGTP